MKTENILKIKNICKAYPRNRLRKRNKKNGVLSIFNALFFEKEKKKKEKEFFNALSNINLKINPGESLGIIGLNGSGKSTLLQILAGTLQPTSGSIKRSGRIAALLELGSGFNPEFTGKENVYLNAQILGLTEEETNEKYEDITRFAEIGEFIDQPVRIYSSGMMLRLAFAVVAHVEPDLLIIDEALAVGDARFIAKCFYFLESLINKNKSIILVSHDMDSIARICTKAMLLHEGKLTTQGETIDVINEYHKVITLNYTNNSKKDSNSTDQVQLLNQHLYVDQNSVGGERWTYGGELGEIYKYSLLNNKSENTSVIESGDTFFVKLFIVSKSKLQNPIFTMKIRNEKGLVIYGTNTSINNINTGNINTGERKEITFGQKANLSPGDYLISIGFTRYIDGNVDVIQRRHDVIKMKVVSDNSSFGIVNLFSEIEINNL